MATIKTRQRKDGSLAYLGEVRVKRDGGIVHRESRTFDRRAQARAWAETREKRFAEEIPVTMRPQKMTQETLRSVLEKYREDVSEVRPMGRSKTSSVRDLKHTTERGQIRRFKYTPEAGYSIVEVQQFTLHDSWGTLSRYTHLRPEMVTIKGRNHGP